MLYPNFLGQNRSNDPSNFLDNNERLKTMREIIRNLNKASLAAATGISYSRLRKYAAGLVKELTVEERLKIQAYLIKLAQQFS